MKNILIALRGLIVLSIICGVIYPLVVFIIGQSLFKNKADGSLIMVNNQVVGSSLIGQSFNSNKYFWGRISATTPYPYNASASGASNYGPLNPDLISRIDASAEKIQATSLNNLDIPIDLLTSSASGLDPDISVPAAIYQADRISQARNISHEQVLALINQHVINPSFGFMGEMRVNVLELNLALDGVKP